MSKSISQLDAITNEAIDLSQFLAIDDPAQTFKLSLLQLRDFFTGQLYPVGSTLFRLDNRTPNECGFPGTWNKIAADLSLHTASADGSNVGVVEGTNYPIVPVPEHNHTGSSATAGDHTHTASSASAGDHAHTGGIWTDAVGDHDHGATGSQDAHSHAATTDWAGDHSHTFPTKQEQNDSGDGADPAAGSIFGNHPTSVSGGHTHTLATDIRTPAVYVDVQPAGTHAHTGGVTINAAGAHAHGVTVDLAGAHAHGVTVDLAGTPGATLDARGARILGNLWQRTA